MNTDTKKIIIKIIIISITILFFEYIFISSMGTFYKIILSFYAIKFLKEQNFIAVKTILVMMFLPLLWSSLLILRTII